MGAAHRRGQTHLRFDPARLKFGQLSGEARAVREFGDAAAQARQQPLVTLVPIKAIKQFSQIGHVALAGAPKFRKAEAVQVPGHRKVYGINQNIE